MYIESWRASTFSIAHNLCLITALAFEKKIEKNLFVASQFSLLLADLKSPSLINMTSVLMIIFNTSIYSMLFIANQFKTHVFSVFFAQIAENFYRFRNKRYVQILCQQLVQILLSTYITFSNYLIFLEIKYIWINSNDFSWKSKRYFNSMWK